MVKKVYIDGKWYIPTTEPKMLVVDGIKSIVTDCYECMLYHRAGGDNYCTHPANSNHKVTSGDFSTKCPLVDATSEEYHELSGRDSKVYINGKWYKPVQTPKILNICGTSVLVNECGKCQMHKVVNQYSRIECGHPGMLVRDSLWSCSIHKECPLRDATEEEYNKIYKEKGLDYE